MIASIVSYGLCKYHIPGPPVWHKYQDAMFIKLVIDDCLTAKSLPHAHRGSVVQGTHSMLHYEYGARIRMVVTDCVMFLQNLTYLFYYPFLNQLTLVVTM